MDSKLINYCEQVICKRLEKYDPVITAEKCLNDKPELDVENLNEDIGIDGVIKIITPFSIIRKKIVLVIYYIVHEFVKI